MVKLKITIHIVSTYSRAPSGSFLLRLLERCAMGVNPPVSFADSPL